MGHAYSINTLVKTKDISLEKTLWAGIRALEEMGSLSNRIAQRLKKQKNLKAYQFYMEKSKNAFQHANYLRELFFFNHKNTKI